MNIVRQYDHLDTFFVGECVSKYDFNEPEPESLIDSSIIDIDKCITYTLLMVTIDITFKELLINVCKNLGQNTYYLIIKFAILTYNHLMLSKGYMDNFLEIILPSYIVKCLSKCYSEKFILIEKFNMGKLFDLHDLIGDSFIHYIGKNEINLIKITKDNGEFINESMNIDLKIINFHDFEIYHNIEPTSIQNYFKKVSNSQENLYCVLPEREDLRLFINFEKFDNFDVCYDEKIYFGTPGDEFIIFKDLIHTDHYCLMIHRLVN